MAIQKEIWTDEIVKGLWADNSFLSRARNFDGFVNQGKTVHVPNAGASSKSQKNRTELPATVSKREDKDLNFVLDEFTTDPVLIPYADTVELSYDKRTSVISEDRASLHDRVANAILYSWSKDLKNALRFKSGKFTKDNVHEVMAKFNKEDVPQEGRTLLIDADQHMQLINSLTAKESEAFYSQVDTARGVIGRLFSFDIMLRSKALLFDESLKAKEFIGEAEETDLTGALAWHKDSVCRAMGEVVMFGQEGDPTMYGDVYSFLLRAGGRSIRADQKGVVALISEAE